jgi:hypothetical protein
LNLTQTKLWHELFNPPIHCICVRHSSRFRWSSSRWWTNRHAWWNQRGHRNRPDRIAILFYQRHKQANLCLQINSLQAVYISPCIYCVIPAVSAAHFVGMSEADEGGDIANPLTGVPHSGSLIVTRHRHTRRVMILFHNWLWGQLANSGTKNLWTWAVYGTITENDDHYCYLESYWFSYRQRPAQGQQIQRSPLCLCHSIISCKLAC